MSGKEANICSDNKQNWGGGGGAKPKNVYTHTPYAQHVFALQKRKASQLVHGELLCLWRDRLTKLFSGVREKEAL